MNMRVFYVKSLGIAPGFRPPSKVKIFSPPLLHAGRPPPRGIPPRPRRFSCPPTPSRSHQFGVGWRVFHVEGFIVFSPVHIIQVVSKHVDL
jgi:hypothetical protein